MTIGIWYEMFSHYIYIQFNMNYFDENISICTPYDCQIHETQRERVAYSSGFVV